MIQTNILSPTFFAQETLTVARHLLGCYLVVSNNGETEHFKIVETEAYTQHDPACHAYRRNTGRAATLYKAPGLSYVYLIYGMYHCLNVVTEAEGTAGAVLFRALEPPAGSSYKTNGPGRLTRALGITKALHHEIPLTSPQSPLYIRPGDPDLSDKIVQTTRIGIKEAQEYPWRFYLKDNPWVSVP